MSTEAIESESNYLNLEDPFIESSKDSEEAIASYQSPGPHSGMARLVEQERFQVSASPNLRGVTLEERCSKLEAFILEQPYTFQHDKGYVQLIKHIAPFDPLLARSFIEKIESIDNKIMGYLEISKHQVPESARKTLREVKERYRYSQTTYYEIFLNIYREEKRRGFPEARETAESLLHALYNSAVPSEFTLYDLKKIALVEEALQKPEIMSTVALGANLAKEEISEQNPILFPYTLVALGGCAGRAATPVAKEFISLMKETIHRIEIGDYDQEKHKEYWPESNQLRVWEMLIEMEATSPYLKPQLQEDVKAYVELINECAVKHPYETFYYDYSLDKLIGILAPIDVELAKQVVPYIKKSSSRFQGAIQIYQEEAKLEGYNKESGFAALEISYKQEFANDPSISMQLFYAAAEHLGTSRADQFLRRAKYLMETGYSDTSKFRFCKEVLEAEIKYRLESRNETLKFMYGLENSPLIYFLGKVELIIEAELSLLR